MHMIKMNKHIVKLTILLNHQLYNDAINKDYSYIFKPIEDLGVQLSFKRSKHYSIYQISFYPTYTSFVAKHCLFLIGKIKDFLLFIYDKIVFNPQKPPKKYNRVKIFKSDKSSNNKITTNMKL